MASNNKTVKKNALPRWKRKARFLQIRERLARIPAAISRLLAHQREAKPRQTRDTRRKFLVGWAVVERLVLRPALTKWVRTVLVAVLKEEHRRLFGLEAGTPLIPEPELPRPSGVAARPAPTGRADAMTPKERQRLIEDLKREERDLKRELRELQAADRGEDEPADPKTHRLIVLGAALMTIASHRSSVTRWLRRLLDTHLKAKRDRVLFRLNESGPLVLEEDSPDLPAIGRRPAKTSASDGQPTARAAAHGRDSPPSVAKGMKRDGSRAAASSGPHHRGASPRSSEDASARDAEQPIPGWQPCRIKAATSSASGPRTRPATEWGARLTGRAAVAAVPQDPCGMTITVTNSNGDSWPTTIIEVVSRDEKAIVVRNSGRPRAGGGA